MNSPPSSPPSKSAFGSFLQTANTASQVTIMAPPRAADPMEMVLAALGDGTVNLPTLFERTRLPVSRLMGLLSEMESMRLVAKMESGEDLLFRATPAGLELAAKTRG